MGSLKISTLLAMLKLALDLKGIFHTRVRAVLMVTRQALGTSRLPGLVFAPAVLQSAGRIRQAWILLRTTSVRVSAKSAGACPGFFPMKTRKLIGHASPDSGLIAFGLVFGRAFVFAGFHTTFVGLAIAIVIFAITTQLFHQHAFSTGA
jgi:hypothetical protein